MLATLIATLTLGAAPPQVPRFGLRIVHGRSVPCADRVVAGGRNLREADECFVCDGPAELRLVADMPGALDQVTLTVIGGSSLQSTEKGRKLFAEIVPLPEAPSAPVLRQSASDLALLRLKGPVRPVASGDYLLELEGGSLTMPEWRGLYRRRVGLTVTASAKAAKLLQWRVGIDGARLALPGCFERSADPVVELVLTDCDDPRYQLKAVSVYPPAGLSLEQYVLNSLGAYAKNWSVVTRKAQTGPPPAIELELEQRIGPQQQALQKHFVQLSGHVLIVTLSGPKGAHEALRTRFGPRSEWLVAEGER